MVFLPLRVSEKYYVKILIVILFLAVVMFYFRALLPDEGPSDKRVECACKVIIAAHRIGGYRNCHRLTRAPRDRCYDIDEYKQPNPNHIDKVPHGDTSNAKCLSGEKAPSKQRRSMTNNMVVPNITWKPWKPVNMKNVAP